MSPYLTILAINAAVVGLAYGAIYPRLDPLTARRMMRADLFVTAVALLRRRGSLPVGDWISASGRCRSAGGGSASCRCS
jgi:hypothetical protein